jgi:hypothetical protein
LNSANSLHAALMLLSLLLTMKSTSAVLIRRQGGNLLADEVLPVVGSTRYLPGMPKSPPKDTAPIVYGTIRK